MNYAAYKFSRGQFPAVQNYFQFQKVFKCLCHSTEGRFISAFQLQKKPWSELLSYTLSLQRYLKDRVSYEVTPPQLLSSFALLNNYWWYTHVKCSWEPREFQYCLRENCHSRYYSGGS